jgi:plastocyanin
MSGFEFVPDVIEVDASDPRLVVSNSDAFLHDLAVPALDAIVRVTPGSSELLELTGAAPGTYVVYCTLHSDTSVDDPDEAGMAATLVLR